MTKFNDVTKGKGKWVTRAEMASVIASLQAGNVSVAEAADDDPLVKNSTGEDLESYSVLKVSSSVMTPDNNANGYKYGPLRLVGDEVSEDDESAIVITQAPANDGKFVRAKASGETKVRLTGPLGGPDTDNKHATTKEGAYTLEASDSGPCVILYDPGPEDEERIAIVRIGGGSTSSGGDEEEVVGNCGPCGPLNTIGAVEVPGVGRLSTGVEWGHPIPGGEPMWISAHLDEVELEYRTLDGYPIYFNCPTEPDPEEEE